MTFYPIEHVEAMAVLYDLRNRAQWTAAGEERRAWGREGTEIHVPTNDHIIIEYKAGGALEASA